MSRRPFIGGNWKSNGSVAQVKSLVEGLNEAKVSSEVDVVVSPIAIHIPYAVSNLQPSIKVAAQNCSKTGNGAFTGEISADAIKDYGLDWVVLGHSERRQYFNETDEVLAEKLKKALKQGLSVIACIGETLELRKANQYEAFLSKQMASYAAAISSEEEWSKIVIAYEPIWAIGTGLTASPQQAQAVHQFLRTWLSKNVSPAVAASTRIIYGGSVKDKNAQALYAETDIDGFLVGGASLKPKMFAKIIAAPVAVRSRL